MIYKIIYVFGSGVLAMLFVFWKNWINKQDEGNDRMKKIGSKILLMVQWHF